MSQQRQLDPEYMQGLSAFFTAAVASMQRLSQFFTEEPKMTLVVCTPGDADDIVISDHEDIDAVIEALKLSKESKNTTRIRAMALELADQAPSKVS